MKLRIIYLVLFGGSAVLLPACSSESKKPTETTTETVSQVAYETVPVVAEQRSKALQLPGEFLARYDVALFAKVNGFIKTLRVDVGDRVRRGQVLAVMEAPELDADLNRAIADQQAARGRLEVSKLTYRRLVQTAKTPGAVAPQELDVAKGQLMGDSAAYIGKSQVVTSARQMKQYLVLTAPFNGIITERLLSPGAFVGPSQKDPQPVLKLKEVERLRLQVTVPEVYAGQLRQHTPVTFSVNAYPGETFRGRINRISYNVERAVRAELIEIEVNNPGLKLMPGMFTQVGFPVQRREKSLYVPSTAVVTSMEGTYVIAVRGGKTHYVPVQIGNETDDLLEVIGGLKSGEPVVAKASDDIRNDIAIRTSPVAPAPNAVVVR
ncbi:efflux RND transporter periplasmic adaptor subunit [Fibrella sp. HMF5335]|uniref:Efflux RND transporter periplasmic adaptor subunit n=1 Tax=Fibrella rubiginis TaxID=2817060 RepID=A0A939GH31_9BACT|nr:efflux RND transporter periplasmic adaptor subunit [Fibrella rubiginis]MBO0936362.1 efflux RND transporter periplasmic adaptor subunit [Fibrella rubiginis]